MEWINIKDRKPTQDQIVLASINGVYKITRFDEKDNCLVELTTNQFFFLDDRDLSVYWTEIETPAV